MKQSIAWSLIYLARALEWWRVYVWNTLWFEREPFARFSSKPLILTSGRCVGRLHTRLGVVADGAFYWMYPTAVWLTCVANRWLPPLGEDEGFLTRLYSPWHSR